MLFSVFKVHPPLFSLFCALYQVVVALLQHGRAPLGSLFCKSITIDLRLLSAVEV